MEAKNQELKRQIIRYIIYLIVVLGLTALSFFLTLNGKFQEIEETITKANIFYLLIVFAIVIASIILRSIVIFSLNRTYNSDYYFHRAIAIDQIGTLYKLVTPAGLGSHIMEYHTYYKQGVKLSDALSVLAIYSIIYQIALIIYNTVTLFFKGGLVVEIGYINFSFTDAVNVPVPLWLLVTAGYIINLTVIAFIFFISYWDGFFNFIRNPIGKLLAKIKVVKNLDKYQSNLDNEKLNYRANLKHLMKNWPIFIISIVCFAIYITISYSTPYFIGEALGNTSPNANFWDSVLLSNFHQMITCIIPIPGSAFSSELFFYRLFYSSNPEVSFYSSEDIARASLLLWRSLMFIIPLIISSIFTIIYRPRKRKEVVADEDQKDQNLQN